MSNEAAKLLHEILRARAANSIATGHMPAIWDETDTETREDYRKAARLIADAANREAK